MNEHGGKTYIIKHIVSLPVPHVGGCPLFTYLASNYSIKLNRQRTPGQSALRRSVFRCNGNWAVHLLLGSMAHLLLFHPIMNDWSDV